MPFPFRSFAAHPACTARAASILRSARAEQAERVGSVFMGTPPRDRTQNAVSRPAHLQAQKDAFEIDPMGPTPLPHRDELPDWAALMMDDPTRYLVELAEKVVGRNGTDHTYTQVPSGGAQLTACTVSVEIGGLKYKMKAQASRKEEAQKAAWLHLLAKLHADGVHGISQTLPATSASPGGGNTTLLDVFRYCASVDATPVIQLRIDAKDRRLMKYTITLEEEGIRVSASHKTLRVACKNASRDFIEAAKKHVRRSGEKDWLVARPSRIDPQDAEAFLQWLANTHSLTWTTRTSQHAEDGALTQFPGVSVSYKSPSESKMLSTPLIWGSSQAEGRAAAVYHAAVSICLQRPEWLAEFREVTERKQNMALESKKESESSKVFKDTVTPKDVISNPAKPLKIAPKTNLNVSLGSYAMMKAVPDLTNTVEKVPAESISLDQRRRRWSRLTGEAKELHSAYLANAYSTSHLDVPHSIRQARAALPVASYKQELMRLVDRNVYSIFIGATGSGKTTQVPQLIFEDWCRRGRGADCTIICTQPRVIAATSVASRVGDELGRKLRNRVGHHVRNNAQTPQPRDGSITFCTTGILLQQLQNEPDVIMDNVSHLVIDEVHERDMVLDFTLAVLKRAVTDRLERGLKVPRILLMSATLDEDVFSNHFKNIDANGELTPAPSLSVPGRSFPVREKFLDEVLKDMERAHSRRELSAFRHDSVYSSSRKYIEDELKQANDNYITALANTNEDETKTTVKWETPELLTTPTALIAETIAHVLRTTRDGAVLVFLPGLGEINKVDLFLRTWRWPILGIDINNAQKYKLFKLHSSLADSQKTVFEPVPPGVRKIILSSPVAETSVTIPDVTCVIDSGQVRELQYDNTTRASWLRNCWINGSSAKQRAGRAGRVQAGTYLAMYSKARREAMPAAGVPELVRADLQSVCLTVKSKIKHVDVPEFLAGAINPPKGGSVEDAMKSLIQIGALTPERDLTSLGRLLCDFPVHPSLAKMIVMGIVFKCLDPIVIAGAAIEQQDLWVSTQQLRKQVVQSKFHYAKGSQSDLIATYNAFCSLRDNDPAVDKSLLHSGVFNRIKESAKAIRDTLVDTGMLRAQVAGRMNERIGGTAFNVNSDNHNVVKAVLVAGLQANIGCNQSRKFCLGDRPDAIPGPSSMFLMKEARTKLSLVAFGELAVAQDSYIMRHISAVSPITAMLFGGSLTTSLNRGAPIFLVNKFLPLPVSVWADEEADEPPKKQAWQVLRQFRKTLDQVLSISFDNMAQARRGIGANVTNESVAVVSEFVDKVVHILNTESHAVQNKLREAMMTRRSAQQKERRQQAAELQALKKSKRASQARTASQANARSKAGHRNSNGSRSLGNNNRAKPKPKIKSGTESKAETNNFQPRVKLLTPWGSPRATTSTKESNRPRIDPATRTTAPKMAVQTMRQRGHGDSGAVVNRNMERLWTDLAKRERSK